MHCTSLKIIRPKAWFKLDLNPNVYLNTNIEY